ncbi:hypothetical protein D3C71_1371750 [compost metagenome]
MLAFHGDAVTQGPLLYALRIFFEQHPVLHDFADETLHHFRHRAEFLRAFRQQPCIQRPALDADAGGEHVAGEIQAAHGVAQEGLLGDGHDGPRERGLYTQCAYYSQHYFKSNSFAHKGLPLPINAVRRMSSAAGRRPPVPPQASKPHRRPAR